jgi:addiction module HigA family antidote
MAGCSTTVVMIVRVADAGKPLQVSRVMLSKILNGKAGITADMALRLPTWLSISPDLWVGIQSQFDLWAAAHRPRPSTGHWNGWRHDWRKGSVQAAFAATPVLTQKQRTYLSNRLVMTFNHRSKTMPFSKPPIVFRPGYSTIREAARQA